MKNQLITILTISAFLLGCTTTEKTESVSAIPTQPEMPEKGRAKEKDVRSWAQYYLDTGTASDMAEALNMARTMFWPDIEDTTSALAKIEEKNEAMKKQFKDKNK